MNASDLIKALNGGPQGKAVVLVSAYDDAVQRTLQSRFPFACAAAAIERDQLRAKLLQMVERGIEAQEKGAT